MAAGAGAEFVVWPAGRAGLVRGRYRPGPGLAVGLACMAVALLASLALATPVTRTVGPFDIRFYNSGDSYTDEDGYTYTGAKNWTATEMDDVEAIARMWDDRIHNQTGRQVRLYVMWSALGPSILGQSSNQFRGDGTTATTFTEYVWRQGVNHSSSGADTFLQFGTGVSWNVGSGSPSSGQIDFRTVVAHELGHPVGFFSTYRSFWDRWSSLGITEWDKRLRDALVDGNQPAPGSKGVPKNFNQTANPAYWVGSYAMAANGGSPVAIYAPAPYEAGSSLTHLNDVTFPNALMKHALSSGKMIREPTALEWLMLKDMGWTLVKNWSKGGGTLSWNLAANWDFAGVPDQLDVVRFRTAGLANGDTVTLGADQSVLSLILDTPVSFTIGGGSGTLTLADGRVERTATSSGTQTLARPIVLGGGSTWDIGGSGRLVVTGVISGPGLGIDKRGNGTLVVAGANTYTGATIIRAGTLAIGAGAPAASPGALGNATSDILLGDTTGSAAAALLIDGPFTVGRNIAVRSGSSGPTSIGGINTSGTATFAGNISFAKGAFLTAAAGGTVEFTDTVSGLFGLNKTGGGTVVLAGACPLTGNLSADEGTLALLGPLSGVTAVTANGSAVVHFGIGQHLGGLILNGTSAADIATGGPTKVLVTPVLSLAESGPDYTATMDINEHRMVIDYTGASPIEDVSAMVGAGFVTGNKGLITTAGAAHPSGVVGVGVYDNGALNGAVLPSPWAGEAIDATSILVRMTWLGDMDFDGKLDSEDYAIIDTVYLDQGSYPMLWQFGDLDLDGDVDSEDYSIIDTTYLAAMGYPSFGESLAGGESFGGKSLAVPVPEPATAVLLLLGLGVVACRRARRRG